MSRATASTYIIPAYLQALHADTHKKLVDKTCEFYWFLYDLAILKDRLFQDRFYRRIRDWPAVTTGDAALDVEFQSIRLEGQRKMMLAVCRWYQRRANMSGRALQIDTGCIWEDFSHFALGVVVEHAEPGEHPEAVNKTLNDYLNYVRPLWRKWKDEGWDLYDSEFAAEDARWAARRAERQAVLQLT